MDRDDWTPHYEPPAEPEATGLGRPGMWVRFGVLLLLVLLPVLFLFQAGDRRLGQEGLRGGRLVWGGEVRSFQICGETQVFWLAGPNERMDSIRTSYERIRDARGLEPYSPVFAELRGSASGRRDSGFARDYDGTFDVMEIVTVRGLRPGECDAIEPGS
jgi:hypothetical protein